MSLIPQQNPLLLLVCLFSIHGDKKQISKQGLGLKQSEHVIAHQTRLIGHWRVLCLKWVSGMHQDIENGCELCSLHVLHLKKNGKHHGSCLGQGIFLIPQVAVQTLNTVSNSSLWKSHFFLTRQLMYAFADTETKINQAGLLWSPQVMRGRRKERDQDDTAGTSRLGGLDHTHLPGLQRTCQASAIQT